jgi:hypothetical protein
MTMADNEAQASRIGRITVSLLLSLCLHAGPAWFLIFGPSYGLPSVLELNLEAMNFYRDRIFRDKPSANRVIPAAIPLHMSVSMQARPDTRKRVSGPRREEELVRARAVQRVIRSLWESFSPERPGYALVTLNIRADGGIGDFAVNRVAGDEEFQAFLLDFLSTLQHSQGGLAGPGEILWIECEFVIQPKAKP